MTRDTDHTNRFEELCTGYVLHALGPEERSEFERMLKQADEKQMELYHKLRSTADNLAFAVEKVEPSQAVKEQLMQVIREELEESDGSVTTTPETGAEGVDTKVLAIAASFALLVVSLSLIFYSFNLSSQLKAQTETLATQQQQLTELQNELQLKDELLAILQSRDLDMVMMKGMEASPNGYGKIIWDAEHQQALLQVSNLPPVPNGMEYQLWIIRNNQPVSAGLFSVNDPGRDSFFKIEEMADAEEQGSDAFAVTLEPKGGMPQPTGDTYLMGNRNE